MARGKPIKKRGRVFKLIEEIGDELTDKQILFCWLYATGRDCFGNATRAYMEAYALRYPSQYNYARGAGPRMLANDRVKKHINTLLDECFKPEHMDRQLAKTAMQDKDLASKVAAIREYNRLKERGKAGGFEGV